MNLYCTVPVLSKILSCLSFRMNFLNFCLKLWFYQYLLSTSILYFILEQIHKKTNVHQNKQHDNHLSLTTNSHILQTMYIQSQLKIPANEIFGK